MDKVEQNFTSCVWILLKKLSKYIRKCRIMGLECLDCGDDWKRLTNNVESVTKECK